MDTITRLTGAKRFSRWLCKGWHGYVRAERRLSGWLVAQGVSAPVATILRWTVNLVALGVLLYAAFWLALLLIFAVVAAWAARHADWDDAEKQPEWREGYDGYGLYDKSGWRIDLGDPDER